MRSEKNITLFCTTSPHWVGNHFNPKKSVHVFDYYYFNKFRKLTTKIALLEDQLSFQIFQSAFLEESLLHFYYKKYQYQIFSRKRGNIEDSIFSKFKIFLFKIYIYLDFSSSHIWYYIISDKKWNIRTLFRG